MWYAQLYTWSSGWNGKDFSGPKEPIEALGSDAVIILDGRLSMSNLRAHAANICKQRAGDRSKFIGYAIMRSPSHRFSEGRIVHPLEMLLEREGHG